MVDERRLVNFVGWRWAISGAVGGGAKREDRERSPGRGIFLLDRQESKPVADIVGEAVPFRVGVASATAKMVQRVNI